MMAVDGRRLNRGRRVERVHPEPIEGLRRRSGLTLTMVRGLPDIGGIVVVHSTAMREYLGCMLRDVRGADFAKRWRIVIVEREGDLTPLLGLRRQIEVDHTVWDRLSRPVERKLRAIAMQAAR